MVAQAEAKSAAEAVRRALVEVMETLSKEEAVLPV
jgi:hypothetical protein